MEKKNTSYLVAIIALTIAVVGMSIGFALNDINITLTGADVTAKATAWDVHIKEIKNATSTGSPTVTTAAAISDDKSLVATYAVELNSVGDAYEFDAIIVNAGDYDAQLTQISISPVSNDYLKHVVTYGGTSYEAATNAVTGTVLEKNDTETVHVKVSYVDPTAAGGSLPTTTNAQTFTVTLKYSPVA